MQNTSQYNTVYNVIKYTDLNKGGGGGTALFKANYSQLFWSVAAKIEHDNTNRNKTLTMYVQ